MAVLFCGLVMAVFTAPWDAKDKITVAAVAVGALWYLIRQIRSAPVCEECGARFSPQKKAEAAASCPNCGEPQAPLRQPSARGGVILCLIGLLVGIFAVSFFAFALASPGNDPALAQSRLPALLMAISSVLFCGLAFAWLIRTAARTRQLADRACPACGERFSAKPPAQRICPNCRSRKLTHDQVRKEQTKSNRSLVIILGMFAISVWALAMAVRVAATTGISAMLFVFAPIAVVLAVVAWLLGRSLIHSRRVARYSARHERFPAPACAGEEGTVIPDGPNTIWYSGPDDPTPMLREENLAARDRIAAFLRETDIPDPSLHILCFHDRAALSKLLHSVFPGLDVSNQLGIFIQPPWNILTLCTTPVAGRLDDPRTFAGSLFCTILLEGKFGQFSAPWIQSGITRALAASRGRADWVGLNRRMLAGRSVGMEWSQEFFTTSSTKLSKMFLRTKGAKRRRFEQFVDQAWSIVEFLAGEHAQESRRTAFRAFLKDKQPGSSREQVFFDHFGFGFGSLLDEWRQWVTKHGIGPDLPPEPRIRDALQNRVLPVIRDRQATPPDRIQAIRNWRVAGTPLGAPALIDLLRDPGDIPKDEIVWALCGASGASFGDDPDRWQAWWETIRSAVET